MIVPALRLQPIGTFLDNRTGSSMSRFGLSVVLPLLLWLPALARADEPADPTKVRAFLQTHCTRCHGPDLAEAELRVDLLEVDFASRENQSRWTEIVNVLNSHEMPPEDEPQPDADEVASVVDWTIARIRQARETDSEKSLTLRRLNRNEYRNTLSDLLGMDVDVSHFPQDASAGGFDNNGQALTISPLLMELYFQTTQDALEAALVSGERPPVMKWRIQPESGNSDSNRVEYDGQRLIVNGGQNRVEGDYKVLHHASWDRTLNFRDFRVAHAGRYRLSIRAAGRVPSREEAVASAEKFYRQRMEDDNKKRPQNKEYHQRAYEENLNHVKTDPIYDYGPPRLKLIRNLGGQPVVIAEMDVAADLSAPQVYTVETEFTTEKAGVTLEYAYDLPRELENFWYQTDDSFARPELWVDWIELEGPLYDQWPPASHRQLLQIEEADPDFPSPEQARIQAAKALKRLMQRAWRRPVTEVELNQPLELFDVAYRENPAYAKALLPQLTAILMSPHFLFVDPNPDPRRSMTGFDQATRLSYFLWSSMPDDELFRAAAQSDLSDPKLVLQQVDRMLADPRSDRFVSDFAGQWLGLREVGANPPAADLYPRYDRHLEQSIVGESEAFFRHVLNEDLDALNFIRSDFVVINERLGRYYGIPNVRGDHFRPVPVTRDAHRGGVLTQASVLSITSNGTRTSPVKRGTWIMKNVLGIDPGLPVANAGDIAPKVPGIDKATVRQRLEIHRELPQCARCHNKIDPLGFALENFNAAGAWRMQEGFGYKGRIGKNDPLIDASARMIDGTEFVGIEGLQDVLLQKEDLFLHCLAGKMMGYALGREMGITDRPQIEAAVQFMKENDRTLRSLIHWIVLSDEFQQKSVD